MSQLRRPDEDAGLTWGTFLDRVYAVPDSSLNEEEHRRWHHLDLESLSHAELLLESERLRLRLLIEDPPSGWLLERRKAIREVLSNVQ